MCFLDLVEENVVPFCDDVDVIEGDLRDATEPVFAVERPGDVKHSQADIRLIEKHGYQTQVDFPFGLQGTVDWYVAHRK